MKRTFILFFGILLITQNNFAQVNTFVEAPPWDGSTTQLRAPNGNAIHAYLRNCSLVLASELTAIAPGSTLTSFGFTLQNGTASQSVTGNFTLYLQNTTDVSYLKGTSWSTILTGMTSVYASILVVPVSASSTSITVTLGTPFVYSGGGLYVAYDWFSTGPFDSGAATYRANSTGLSPGTANAYAPSGPAPTALSTTAFRPDYLFGFANTYTNDIVAIGLDAPGRVPSMFNTPHTVRAMVKNGSNITKTNIPVTLNITGPNPATITQTIASLAAGLISTVNFSTYNPINPGLSTFSLSVPADQNNTNNSGSMTQSVNCNEFGVNPPVSASAFTYNAVGFGNGAGNFSYPYTFPATASVSALRILIANYAANAGNPVYGIVMDNLGTIIATSNTITLTNTHLGTFVTFTFASPPSISTGYFLGLAQTANTVTAYFPMGAMAISAGPFFSYYSGAITGGATASSNNFGTFGIEAVLVNNLIITGNSPTITCGGAATLNVTGGNSYTWTNGPNASTYPVSPTVTTIYSVSATNTLFCSNSNTFAVVVNQIPVSGTASPNIICGGSNCTLSATGAASYTWNTSSGPVYGSSLIVNPTSNASYSFSGSNPNGCVGNTVVNVNVNPAPNLNISSITNAICLGNSLVLSGSGANSYSWSTNSTNANITVSPTVTTTYILLGTSAAGCTATASSVITVNSFTPVISSPTAVCSGSQVTISASGGAANSYTWSNGVLFFSNINLTINSSTVINVLAYGSGNSCLGSNGVTITAYPNPTLQINLANQTMCKGESNTLTVSGAASYSWSNGQTSSVIVIQPTVASTINYNVTGLSVNLCSTTSSVSIKVDPCTGLNQGIIYSQIKVYPNPNSGKFYLSIPENYFSRSEVKIYNVLGEIVSTEKILDQNQFIDLSSQPNGIYFLQFLDNNSQLILTNIIKE